MTHPTTHLLHRALGPAITDGDGGLWLAWLDGPASLLGEVDDVVRDTDLPGWAAELTVDRTHRPRWTAQLLGVRVPAGATDGQARTLIRERPAFRRGTPEAMLAAAQATLTGSRYVNLLERDGGSAYQLRVQTFLEQTPDPAATEAALRAQKPAGIVLTFQMISMTSWLVLEGEAAQSYADLESEAAQTYTALEG